MHIVSNPIALSAKIYSVLAFAMMVLMASCKSGNQDIVAEQQAKVKTGVTQFADSIATNITRDGPIAWLKYFNDSPTFFMASDGQLVFNSHDAADKFIKTTLIKAITKINLKWSNLRIDPLTPDIAMMAANFHEDLTDNTDKTTPCDGYFTAVAQQTGKGWQLRNAHWSIKH